MRLTSLLYVTILLGATAGTVGAAGINLFWNDCSLGAAAATNRDFACDTNTGSHDLYASFDPPPGLTAVHATETVVDLQSATPGLPLWWQFKNGGSCRQFALDAYTIFPLTCTDPWQGNGVAGISAYLVTGNTPSMAPNRARIIGVASVPGTQPNPVDPGTEYFSIRFRITSDKTVGTGSCEGCSVPVCLILQQITIQQPAGTPGGNPTLMNPLASNYATWQGGAIGGVGCPGATPTLNRTWGRMKTMYR